MRKILLTPTILTIGLAPIVSVTACNHNTKSKNITLNHTFLALDVGKTFKLNATVEPEGTICELQWTSSDNNVATVDDNGVITAKTTGEAVITVQSIDFKDVQATCTVKVNEMNNYFTVTALEESTFQTYGYGDDESGSMVTLDYSLDNANWIHHQLKPYFSNSITIPKNSTLKLRGSNSKRQFGLYGVKLLFTGKVALSGNIMSLVDGFKPTTDIPCPNCFDGLFMVYQNETFIPYFDSIVSAEDLILPDDDLTNMDECYAWMFAGNHSIEKAPRLQAKTLSRSCYDCMFYGCSSLNEIKLDYTGDFIEDYFDFWVREVPPTGGTFYYNGNDKENFGDNAIPGIDSENHWEVKTFE